MNYNNFYNGFNGNDRNTENNTQSLHNMHNPHNSHSSCNQHSDLHNFMYTPPPAVVTVKRRGKFKSVLAACTATLLFGAAVGFGSSQILVRVLDIPGSGGISREEYEKMPDREVPDVISDAATDSMVKETPDREIPSNVSTSGSSDTSKLMTAEELFENLRDTVVGIKISESGFGKSEIIGSGVIISNDGYIITCEHVIRGADKVYVVVDDYLKEGIEHEYEAEVYGKDKSTDLAVLKITRKEPFRYAKIGNSEKLKIGQEVSAIGNPMGLAKTMTKGIVSGLQRDLSEDNAYMLPLIQTDTALNPGNSGCPLFDMYGNVIGIVNSKLVQTGGTTIDNLGFAISINEAMLIIEELIKHGAVTTRPAMGITAMEGVQIHGFDSADYGLQVETINPGTPALESGLMRGDIIFKVDGEEVSLVSETQKVLKDKTIGDKVTVTVVRYNNFGEANEMEFTFALIAAGR